MTPVYREKRRSVLVIARNKEEKEHKERHGVASIEAHTDRRRTQKQIATAGIKTRRSCLTT